MPSTAPPRPRPPRVAAAAPYLLALLAASACRSAPVGGPEPTSAAVPALIEAELLPDTDFYPSYIASPNRAQTAFVVANAVESDLDEAGAQRFLIRMGGPIGVVRFSPPGEPERGFQVDIEIGFAGVFDAAESLDNIGWNGIFGIRGAYKPTPDFALQFGTLHNSSHVGDEYAQRTGRRRIEYTREEAVVGASWWPNEAWRLYTETGIAFAMQEFQERIRIEAGFEVVGPESWWFAGVPWYVAFDADAFEERDYEPALTGQLGVIVDAPEQGSRVRFAFEAYHGRSWMGEFSFEDETHVGFGVFYDW